MGLFSASTSAISPGCGLEVIEALAVCSGLTHPSLRGAAPLWRLVEVAIFLAGVLTGVFLIPSAITELERTLSLKWRELVVLERTFSHRLVTRTFAETVLLSPSASLSELLLLLAELERTFSLTLARVDGRGVPGISTDTATSD